MTLQLIAFISLIVVAVALEIGGIIRALVWGEFRDLIIGLLMVVAAFVLAVPIAMLGCSVDHGCS